MRQAGLAALLMLTMCGCTSSQQAAAKPSPSHQASAGGCAGTVLTYGEPPGWAQGGWTHTQGTPWPVPWAMGSPGDAVAFVFAVQLVAGAGARPDGAANKVLWVVRDAAAPFVVEGRPLGQSQPVVRVPGGPSIVDVPSPGCWTFRMLWSGGGAHISTVNLQVLPTGTSPTR